MSKDEFFDALELSFFDIHLSLSKSNKEQLFSFYLHLIETNKKMNLTAITDEQQVIEKHFLDSAALLHFFDIPQNSTVMDVGTGAGFPGIVLAILRPDISFTLSDSLNKRLLFLEDVVSICNLKNVSLIHGRAEELGHDSNYRSKYDVVVSRAVACLPVLLEYTIPFLKVHGHLLAYKSTHADEEISNSLNAQKVLSISLNKKIEYDLCTDKYHRCLLDFQLNQSIKKCYPRKAGLPKRQPL